MFNYFGYGSNLNLTSLRAKGVEPLQSDRATLPGWRLRFNVRHWFRHEGGVGNIEATGNAADRVEGLVHLCEDAHLPPLDAVEACGVGYDRIEVEVHTAGGPVRALTYIGMPAFLDDASLPSRRYLNILLRGALAAGLDAAYTEELRAHPVHPEREYPAFEHPADSDARVFDAEGLARHPHCTALAGAVFDMTGARPDLDSLVGLFGGRDMTLFHLKRLDTSDGNETLDDVKAGRISAAGRRYLDAYLHEYSVEFRYVGRFIYT
jgi:hypothetical protein